jgi:hypothetical protein
MSATGFFRWMAAGRLRAARVSVGLPDGVHVDAELAACATCNVAGLHAPQECAPMRQHYLNAPGLPAVAPRREGRRGRDHHAARRARRIDMKDDRRSSRDARNVGLSKNTAGDILKRHGQRFAEAAQGWPPRASCADRIDRRSDAVSAPALEACIANGSEPSARS